MRQLPEDENIKLVSDRPLDSKDASIVKLVDAVADEVLDVPFRPLMTVGELFSLNHSDGRFEEWVTRVNNRQSRLDTVVSAGDMVSITPRNVKAQFMQRASPHSSAVIEVRTPLPARMRLRRRELDMSQGIIATALNVSRSTVG